MSSVKPNAIILAAGTSSRFVPLSAETPKGLLEVRGEIMIERQIRQLKDAGINDITVVTGYMQEQFLYLKDKFGVSLVYNGDYYKYNNTSSMIRVLDKLGNTYICSSDNYFTTNVFLDNPECSYYSSLLAEGSTDEYCLETDSDDNITGVHIGGKDSWYMIGHVYFSDDFSRTFKELLRFEYEKEETRNGYWEDVYIKYIDKLPFMKIRRYQRDSIMEFDTLEELRSFDRSYIYDTRSSILKSVVLRLNCEESSLSHFENVPHRGNHLRFSFLKSGRKYIYDEIDNSIILQ